MTMPRKKIEEKLIQDYKAIERLIDNYGKMPQTAKTKEQLMFLNSRLYYINDLLSDCFDVNMWEEED